MTEHLWSSFDPEGEKRFVEPSNFAIWTPTEFLDRYCGIASQAFRNPNLPAENRRLGVKSMYTQFFEGETLKLYLTLLESAMRGFETKVVMDGFSQLVVHGIPRNVTDPLNLFNLLTGAPVRNPYNLQQQRHFGYIDGFKQEALRRLGEAGAKVIYTNPIDAPLKRLTYFLKGGDHRKICYAPFGDKMVVWIGGLNLADGQFRMIDLMVELTDPEITEPLINEFSTHREKSAEIHCTKETSLLADGTDDESIIIKKTVGDINAAEKGETILVISWFRPSGRVPRALDEASKRGVRVLWVRGESAVKIPRQYLPGLREPKIPEVILDQGVHAKGYLRYKETTDGIIGTAIVGSHNFVNAPFEELSLKSTSPVLVGNLLQFFKEALGPSFLQTRRFRPFTFHGKT